MSFEVTETAVIRNEAAASTFLAPMRALGCQRRPRRLRDGLRRLPPPQALPVDILKIDVEFVRDLPASRARRHVVEAVVSLARAFGSGRSPRASRTTRPSSSSRAWASTSRRVHIGRPAPTHEVAIQAAGISHQPAAATDRIALVRMAFHAFMRRNVDGMEAHLQPDVELRPLGTAAKAGRTAPYTGYAGIRKYLEDIEAVWDSLEVRPQVFQNIEDGVAVFGDVIGQSEDGPVSVDVVWVWKLRDGLISSIQVFQS